VKLRPYQIDTLTRCREAYRAGARRVILQLQTGGGKTICASVVCRNSTATGQRVLYVVHRDAILRQTARALKAAGVTVDTLTAGDPAKEIAAGTVLLASAQTLARRNAPEFDFGVWDESHTFYKLQQKIQNDARWLLLTATPTLATGAPLSAIADAIVPGPSDDFLTDSGYLVPLEVYGAPSPDLHGVPIVKGDFHPGKLQQAHMVPKLVGKAAESMQRHARVNGRWMRTMVYCAGLDHSRQVCAELVAIGCRAVHIDGSTPPGDRALIYADLAAQRIDAICNYGVAIEGLDIPEIECVASFRAMGSLCDFLQSLGRGRRPSVGKTKCVYIDGGGNCYRHGWPTQSRPWTLTGKTSTAKAPITLRTCGECLAIYPPELAACPRCGAQPAPEPRKGPQTVDGELVRLSAAELERRAKAASSQTPPRPCPQGLDAALWDRLERRRQRDGYALGDGSRAHPGWTAVAYQRISCGKT
jgi:superfamily II DNA or RNA helicase